MGPRLNSIFAVYGYIIILKHAKLNTMGIFVIFQVHPGYGFLSENMHFVKLLVIVYLLWLWYKGRVLYTFQQYILKKF
jgi:pyruvate carboxylase